MTEHLSVTYCNQHKNCLQTFSFCFAFMSCVSLCFDAIFHVYLDAHIMPEKDIRGTTHVVWAMCHMRGSTPPSTVVSLCGHTFFRRLSLSIGQPPPPAQKSSYLHQKRQEVSSSAALTKMKPRPLNGAIYGENTCSLCATRQCNTRMRFFHAS